MKQHQRKAKIKRAKQHQEYCKSPQYQETQRVKWQEDLKRYDEEYAQFERETEAHLSVENRLTLKRVMIIVLSWVGVVFGLAWIAERFV